MIQAKYNFVGEPMYCVKLLFQHKREIRDLKFSTEVEMECDTNFQSHMTPL